MADGNVTVNVTVEQAVHLQIRQMLQAIYEFHGLRIDVINAYWDFVGPKAVAVNLQITSTSTDQTGRPHAGCGLAPP